MTTHRSPTRHDGPTDHRRPVAAPHSTRTGGLVGTVLALVATLSIYVVGNLGAPIRVITGWAPDGADLSIGEVIGTVVVAVVAGTVLLGILERHVARAWRTWMIIAASFAVASAVPLTRLDVDRGSQVALVAMHLATGAAAIAGHAIVRRRSGRPDPSR